MNLGTWLAQAGSDPVLFLPRLESHPAGAVVGLLSALLGALAYRLDDFNGRDLLGWLALAGVLAGMLLHARFKRADTGWRVDFAARSVEPVGLRGGPEAIVGTGWSIQVAPGERRAGVAIDLRHADRGRVARLLDVPARSQRALRQVDQLADRLAERLAVPRSGLRL